MIKTCQMKKIDFGLKGINRTLYFSLPVTRLSNARAERTPISIIDFLVSVKGFKRKNTVRSLNCMSIETVSTLSAIQF